MSIPKALKKGDTVAIISPAKAINKESITAATEFWIKNGYRIKLGKHCCGQYHYFSGEDKERAADLQAAIDDPNVKAIICSRGGYGCIRILDRINWAGLVNHPKWLVGFSDVTFFHHHLSKLNIASMHATMPLNYIENTKASLQSMLLQLEGNDIEYNWKSTPNNKEGVVEGNITGGNLTIISSLIGTDLMPDYSGKILFLEDVGEHLYAVDRMFYQLAKSGVLDKIKGLILGGFTNMEDTDIPFGKSIEQIIAAHFKYRNIPISFHFPAGHQNDNRAIIFGKKHRFLVDKNASFLKTV